MRQFLRQIGRFFGIVAENPIDDGPELREYRHKSFGLEVILPDGTPPHFVSLNWTELSHGTCFLVGSSPEAHVVLESISVAPFHLAFVLGEHVLSPRDSLLFEALAPGIKLNGEDLQAFQHARISAGEPVEEISIGDMRLRYRTTEETTSCPWREGGSSPTTTTEHVIPRDHPAKVRAGPGSALFAHPRGGLFRSESCRVSIGSAYFELLDDRCKTLGHSHSVVASDLVALEMGARSAQRPDLICRDGNVEIIVYVGPRRFEELSRYSNANGINVSDTIRLVLERRLKRYVKPQGSSPSR